jgi:hypothetical protein
MIARFEPARFSIPDLHFLLEHLGTPPVVAMRKPLAPGTHAQALREVLETVYEHEQLRAAEDSYAWAGIDAIQDGIQRFIEWHERSREIQRRGARDSSGGLISHPSMYVWDDGRAFRFGVDADSAEMVRTEILPDGSRKPFGVTLANPHGDNLPNLHDVMPWVKTDVDPTIRKNDKITDEKSEKNNRIAHLRCTICDDTQTYDPRVPQSRRIAMARMIRHLKTAKVNVNRHRILLSKRQGG